MMQHDTPLRHAKRGTAQSCTPWRRIAEDMLLAHDDIELTLFIHTEDELGADIKDNPRVTVVKGDAKHRLADDARTRMAHRCSMTPSNANCARASP